MPVIASGKQKPVTCGLSESFSEDHGTEELDFAVAITYIFILQLSAF